ncbi:MAG: phosphonate metabolism transcriptional regulator PhnF [Pseudomonadota bacterium]
MPTTTNKIPVWRSIYTTLSGDIGEGRYAQGDKLPTEAALSQRFGVNRHTVRRALAQLAEDGTVHARRGAGVFVTQEPTLYPIGKRVRFHQNLQAAGLLPTKEVLALETRMAGKDEAEILALEARAMVHVYEGISRADDRPVALARTIFPAARFPNLPQELTRYHSISKALQKCGLADYTRAWTQLTAKRASATQAGLLQISEGAPLLRTVSLSVDEDSVPVEYGRTWFAGDRVTLTVGDD